MGLIALEGHSKEEEVQNGAKHMITVSGTRPTKKAGEGARIPGPAL